ncbi:tRNA isopentenyltransferase [Xylariaceae sp. FL0594]|nr:tRNA isopentenyltransferase [Xylariaceae sp. FL0594]
MAPLNNPKEPLVAIIGTTGTGKSDLAVDLAVRFNGEVINADAMQMYRGLPVITNQISQEEQRGIPHHLLGHVDPLEPTWTNGLFVQEARRIIKEIRGRGRLPIVVGGTHYYIHSLLFEGSLISSKDVQSDQAKFRSHEEQASHFPILSEPTEVILQRLREVDPVMADHWHPGDRRKISRSLEIYLSTGKRASDIYAQQQRAKQTRVGLASPWETLIFWVHTSADVLKARLEKRVDKMLQRGLMDEVEVLHRRLHDCSERGVTVDRTYGIWQSIGFKEMETFLDGKLKGEPPDVLEKKKNKGLEEINIATRQYARYQSRWIRQKGLKDFKDHNVLDYLYLFDSTNADEFSANVLDPAAGICRQFLAGETPPRPTEVSVTAREILSALSSDDAVTKIIFKVRTCEVCKMSVATENEWEKHIKGRRHRRGMVKKKYLSLVPIESVESRALLPMEVTSEAESMPHDARAQS